MLQPSKAVFLSYASQDAESAARICDALRAAGVEVWFDQSELRGGDAWDHHIRHQIRDCALFIPIISEHTQARAEGYFRLEWRLAEERTHLMGWAWAFIVPVCVDGTSEKDADVPDSFEAVQWTRLAGGHTPGSFCERVAAVLGGAGTPGQASMSSLPVIPIVATPKFYRWIFVALAGALVVLAGSWQAWRLMQPKPRGAAMQASATAAIAAPEKSIAVLPFVDMSEKHDQEYFSDGLSEELIDHLAHSTDLKVIGRTSSFAFKGKNEDMRTIAAKLGVANLLEGSVRKAGVELRITAQLVRASDGVHLWSQSFDRKLADIFKVQEEISDTVAKALNVALGTRSPTTERGTKTIEAYNLVLQGYYFFMRGNTGDNQRSVAMYQRALKLDPQYSVAWAKLARVYAWQEFTGEIPAAEAEAMGRDAVRRALEIDPNCAEAYFARGNILRLVAGDWTGADSDYKMAAMLDPDGDVAYSSQNNIVLNKTLITGQFGDYFPWARNYLARNPLDSDVLTDLALVQQATGLLDDSAVTSRKILEIKPAYATAPAQYAQTLLLMGKNSEALSAVEEGVRSGKQAHNAGLCVLGHGSASRIRCGPRHARERLCQS